MPEVRWKKLKGRTVDSKFPLLECLGGSDHSTVFLTEIADGEPRKAAVKLIAQDSNPEAQLSRLRSAVELSHPHLLRIFEVGPCEVDGTRLIYIVTELAEEDLSQVLPQRPLTPAETRDVLAPVLDVLTYIHAQGLVHSRIRPSNISAVNDQLKLSADSICKPSEAPVAQQNLDAYDAPERAHGKISPACDMWSLGATLVAALTQKPPALPALPAADPIIPESIPEPFRSISRECLHRNPDQRCTSGSVVALLEPREQTATARPLPAVSRARSKAHYWIPAVALLALAGLFVGSRFFHSEERTTNVVAAPSAASRPATAPAKPAATRGSANRAQIVRQVLPEVPKSARNTIHGKIRVNVQVNVDSSGRVVSEKLTLPGPSHYFANLALKAAQKWEFTPSQVDGQRVASTWLLRFQFARSSTQVFPSQQQP